MVKCKQAIAAASECEKDICCFVCYEREGCMYACCMDSSEACPDAFVEESNEGANVLKEGLVCNDD